MKSFLYQKIVAGMLILTIVSAGFFTISTRQAQADGVACTGGLAVSIGQLIIATIKGVVSAPASEAGKGQNFVNNWFSSSERITSCILKPLAQMMVVALIRNIGSSIVNWVNSGFQGKPLFVTDFEGTLRKSADQAVGTFIEGTDLGFLCSNFSFRIRLALALKYSQPFDDQVRCTLSDITRNVNNFVNNNGGAGWDNWLQVTTQPTNNIYGAYLIADSELAQRMAQAADVKEKRVSLAQGFLDYETCNKYETDQAARMRTLKGDGTFTTQVTRKDGTYATNTAPTTETSFNSSSEPQCLEKTVSTPGRVVADQLQGEFLSGPIQRAVATEIDQVISATLNQLALKVVQGATGLLGLSKKSSSSGTSYIDKYRAQFYGQTTSASVNADAGASSPLDDYTVTNYDESAALRNDPTNSSVTGIDEFTNRVGGEQIHADQNQGNSVVNTYGGGVTEQNVALGKSSTQSSTLNNASYGNDGIKQTSQYVKGAETSPQEDGGWWELDLGSDHPIKTVNIYKNPTPSTENGELEPFTLQVRSSTGDSASVQSSAFSRSSSDGSLLTTSIGKSVRYIRINKQPSGGDGFCSWNDRYSDEPGCFTHLAFAELEAIEEVALGSTASSTSGTGGSTGTTTATDNRPATTTLSWNPMVASAGTVTGSLSQTATLSAAKPVSGLLLEAGLYDSTGKSVAFADVFDNFQIMFGSNGAWTPISFNSTDAQLQIRNVSVSSNATFSIRFIGQKKATGKKGSFSFVTRVADSKAVFDDKTQRVDFVVQ